MVSVILSSGISAALLIVVEVPTTLTFHRTEQRKKGYIGPVSVCAGAVIYKGLRSSGLCYSRNAERACCWRRNGCWVSGEGFRVLRCNNDVNAAARTALGVLYT